MIQEIKAAGTTVCVKSKESVMTDIEAIKSNFDAIKIVDDGEVIDLTGMTRKDRTRLVTLLSHIVTDRDALCKESRQIRHHNNVLSKIAAFTSVAAIYLLFTCIYLMRIANS
jgi:hypothetical protein